MKIDHLDHLVLTVADIDKTIAFYVGVLGMSEIRFGEGRRALAFGKQKINLHLAGHEFEPKARHPKPGSADLCFIVETPLDEIITELAASSVAIVEGPVERTGALGPIRSIYIRDPDENLIELTILREAGHFRAQR